MDITVAICTWNRVDLLAQTLDKLVAMEIPREAQWELLVIDNASTDGTRNVAESFSDRLPIRCAHEPKLGLSSARNCAIDLARGKFIAWIDDDVLVEPHWLSAYLKGMEVYSTAVVFGGVIKPLFEVPPPSWMDRAWPMICKYHAIKEVPEGGGAISSSNLPNGANFSIRTDVQKRHRYDPTQGRRGDELFSGEESTVIRKILDDGGTGIWLPEARVQHFLPASRMTLRYLRRTVSDSGKQDAFRKISIGQGAERDVRLLGSPRWLWRKALETHITYLIKRSYLAPEFWMPAMLRASWTWGEIRGYRAYLKS